MNNTSVETNKTVPNSVTNQTINAQSTQRRYNVYNMSNIEINNLSRRLETVKFKLVEVVAEIDSLGKKS